MPKEPNKLQLMKEQVADFANQLVDRLSSAVGKRIMIHLGDGLGWVELDIHRPGSEILRIDIRSRLTGILESVAITKHGIIAFQLVNPPKIQGPIGLTLYRLKAFDARTSTLVFQIEYLSKILGLLAYPDLMVTDREEKPKE